MSCPPTPGGHHQPARHGRGRDGLPPRRGARPAGCARQLPPPPARALWLRHRGCRARPRPARAMVAPELALLRLHRLRLHRFARRTPRAQPRPRADGTQAPRGAGPVHGPAPSARTCLDRRRGSERRSPRAAPRDARAAQPRAAGRGDPVPGCCGHRHRHRHRHHHGHRRRRSRGPRQRRRRRHGCRCRQRQRHRCRCRQRRGGGEQR